MSKCSRCGGEYAAYATGKKEEYCSKCNFGVKRKEFAERMANELLRSGSRIGKRLQENLEEQIGARE